ncbi:MAG: hypothetical protein ABIP48_23985 [Planctomycetota bacterium]
MAALAQLEQSDPQRFALLTRFLNQVRQKEVLPQAEDMRILAELAGLKSLAGKSRKALIPRLFAHLSTLQLEVLDDLIRQAPAISAQSRREGYSVLTDRLLGDMKKQYVGPRTPCKITACAHADWLQSQDPFTRA